MTVTPTDSELAAAGETKNYRIAIDSLPVYSVSGEVSPNVFGIELTAAEFADWQAVAAAWDRWQERLGAY